MASTFTVVTEAPFPVDALFDISLDIDAHVASMAQSGERAIGGTTSGRIRLGESVTWRARHFGVWFTMTSRITACERPHRFVDEQVMGPFKTFRHEHLFEALDGGRCRMTDHVAVGSPVLGRLVEAIVLVPYLQRLITQRNAHLVEVLGSQPSPADG